MIIGYKDIDGETIPVVCSWHEKEPDWIEPAKATHTICDECVAKQMKELERLRAA